MKYQNLGEVLEASACRYPFRTAIVFGQKKISYKELNELTDRFAGGLIRLGIKKQDKVALFLDNCPEFVMSYYSVLKAGAVVIPINYMFKIEEAKYILQDSEATCIITSRAYADITEKLMLRLDNLKHIITTSRPQGNCLGLSEIRKHSPEGLHNITINPTELAVILYTSGTTGFPKGAMLTHENLLSNATDCSYAIKVTHRDTFICILPLFHSFAATVCMNLPLLIGAKIVIMKSLKPFKRIIRAIIKNKVNVFVGIPSIYNILKDIKLPKILRGPLIKLFNPIKVCISGAAALPSETFKAFENKFRIPLLEGYGLTEASPVVTLNPLKGKRVPGSIGIALSRNIKLRVVNEQGEGLGCDKVGELIVKGHNVMQGYYKHPEATAETLKNNWLYTGDMARMDEEGYVYIVGSKKEMINVRGLNVYPREIEEVLYQNHKIKEAAVVGVVDTHKGEVPKGFIVLKDKEKASEQEIIQYLRDNLAPYKIPKHIEIRDSLPKTSTGKILKRVLQDEEKQKTK